MLNPLIVIVFPSIATLPVVAHGIGLWQMIVAVPPPFKVMPLLFANIRTISVQVPDTFIVSPRTAALTAALMEGYEVAPIETLHCPSPTDGRTQRNAPKAIKPHIFLIFVFSMVNSSFKNQEFISFVVIFSRLY
jgi:hypothetical protein